MFLLLGGLFIASYVLFMMIAEQMNPFYKPHAPLKRRRWRLGRRAGVTLLFVGVLFLLNVEFVLVTGWWQLLAFGLVAAAMLAPAFRRFFRSRQWGKPNTADQQA